MVRSSGIPRQHAHKHLTSIIQARSEPKTVVRVTETTNSLDEVVEEQNGHTEYLWLTDATEGQTTELVGEQQTGTLTGLTVADGYTNIQVGDLVTYGGIEYEVESVVGKPEDAAMDASCPNTRFWLISFERRQ